MLTAREALSLAIQLGSELFLEGLPSLDLVGAFQELAHLVHLLRHVRDHLLKLQCLLVLSILGDCILDLLDTSGILQRVLRLSLIVDRWRSVHKHECLSGTSEGVPEDHGQCVITIGDVRIASGQGSDDRTERGERHVDGVSFLLTLLRDTGLGRLFGTGKIDEGELTDVTHVGVGVSGVDQDGEDEMGPTRLVIHVCLTDHSPLKTLTKDGLTLINTLNLNSGTILENNPLGSRVFLDDDLLLW